MRLLEPSSETRKQVAFRIIDEIFNEGALGVIDKTCSRTIVVHNSKLPDVLKGIDAFKGFLKDFLWAFRDIHLHIDDLHTEGDMVDCHASFTAMYRSAFMGKPATQKEVNTEPVFSSSSGPMEK